MLAAYYRRQERLTRWLKPFWEANRKGEGIDPSAYFSLMIAALD
jgi:hypothetical protein